jgi:hypothetical protein
VTHAGTTGFVASTAVRPSTVGAQTVDLPVPVIYTVSNPAGATMLLDAADASKAKALPRGTRLRGLRCMVPRGILTDHDEMEVVDGPHLGSRGYVLRPDVKLEALGTQ